MIPFGEPCSGMTHEIQMLTGLMLPKELQASLGRDSHPFFIWDVTLSSPGTRQACVSVFLGRLFL